MLFHSQELQIIANFKKDANLYASFLYLRKIFQYAIIILWILVINKAKNI